MVPKTLIVIGGGPGGYAAALEAARRGAHVILIEQNDLGGTCLNRGCIPSKFFLSQAAERSATSGVPDMTLLVRRKEEIVATLRGRMEQAAKAGRIERKRATAKLLSDHEVECRAPGEPRQTVMGDAIILATGSSPVKPSLFPDHPAILDSTSILNIDYLPSHLVVVGGGYIGCELACAFQGLGSKVTLIEKEKRLLGTQPEFEAAAGVLQRSFEKRGLTVLLQTQIAAVSILEPQRVSIKLSNGDSLESNAVLLALGRSPNLLDLNLSSAGIALLDGRLRVNNVMQTNVPHIYAIGDLVSPVPLAHVAVREAETAICHLWGETHSININYPAMPRCVYTQPEIAAVGMTEAQAQSAGYSPRVDRYHFAANAKALVEEDAEGFWLIVTDSSSHKILGGQIIGPHATELIHLIALSIKAGLRTDDVADTVFAHPSLSESFQEAMSRAVKSISKAPRPQ